MSRYESEVGSGQAAKVVSTRVDILTGYAAPVEELREITEYREPGKLTARNLLLSGDNPHRERARSRFTIDTATGLINR